MCLLEFIDDHTWIITLLTVPSTVGFAVWKLNHQFGDTIKAQRTNKLDELHLNIYKDIADKIKASQAGLTKIWFATHNVVISFEFKIAADKVAIASGLTESSVNMAERYIGMVSEHSEVMDKIAEVLYVMDTYEIAFSDFASIRRHISEKHQELVKAMEDFHSLLRDYLPMDVKEEDRENFGGLKVLKQAMPDPASLDKIRTLATVATQKNLDLSCYLHDLLIEAQNELLSPVFQNKQVPKRVPGDPRYQVLTRDTSEKTDK